MTGITRNPNMMNKYQALLSNVYTPFVPQWMHVLQSKRLGVTCGTIELIEATSSQHNNKFDRFLITIPYAKQKLHWNVMFDAAHPELGPDFDFGDKNFFADPDIELVEKNVPSLVNWNLNHTDCLLKVLVELLLYYKRYQRSRLYERPEFEYSMLIGESEICEEDIETILIPDHTAMPEAHFLIRIATDFSKLPKKNSESDQLAVMLHVVFRGNTYPRVTPQIYFSSSLSDVLGNMSNFHIPPFSSDTSLMDYVPEIKRMINDKVNAVITNYEKKKSYIDAVLCLQGESIIEYDASDFSSVTLLLEHRDFHFLVHIKLSLMFPNDPPKIFIYSIYNCNENSKEPFKSQLKNINYSPTWKPEQMIVTALQHIVEKEVDLLKIKTIRMSTR